MPQAINELISLKHNNYNIINHCYTNKKTRPWQWVISGYRRVLDYSIQVPSDTSRMLKCDQIDNLQNDEWSHSVKSWQS